MKKLFSLILGLALVPFFLSQGFAEKPDDKGHGPLAVDWNLSGAVMPVPPYGSFDIFGSDSASKLKINQPDEGKKITITGEMKGLHPNTTYTVFLSNGYEPYVETGWSFEGVMRFIVNGGGSYDHDIKFTATPDGTLTGTGGYPAGGSYSILEGVTGTISGTSITMHITQPGSYFADAIGTIAPDGTIVGTWQDNNGVTGTFSTQTGFVVKTGTGSTGWPGLFSSRITPFTFTTNSKGSANWHIKMKHGDFIGKGPYELSVWINEGGTMLISDVFTVDQKTHECKKHEQHHK